MNTLSERDRRREDMALAQLVEDGGQPTEAEKLRLLARLARKQRLQLRWTRLIAAFTAAVFLVGLLGYFVERANRRALAEDQHEDRVDLAERRLDNCQRDNRTAQSLRQQNALAAQSWRQVISLVKTVVDNAEDVAVLDTIEQTVVNRYEELAAVDGPFADIDCSAEALDIEPDLIG